MEHVIVKYPASRDVYIDGDKNGLTNESLRVDAGTHIFDLGSPHDYDPDSQEVEVVDTTILKPLEVTFNGKDE